MPRRICQAPATADQMFGTITAVVERMMSHPGFDTLSTEQLATVGGGTRMCTSGTSDDTLSTEMMQMMSTMQSSLSSLSQNNSGSSSSMSMMMPMMMMMKNKQA
ncbi:MAG TPA: hypothetical protein VH143_11245 [Kofleriaceae bacterium]|jgi:hypothetical protein|nr:hypothetical protein [Kofleriaceae bacterium]